MKRTERARLWGMTWLGEGQEKVMMPSDITPRERIAKFEPLDPRTRLAWVIFPDGFIDSSREYTTEKVIAHLWEQAMKSETVEAVAEVLYDLRVQEGNSLSHDGTLSGIPYASWRNAEKAKARAAITTTLTALLGPNPNEQEAK